MDAQPRRYHIRVFDRDREVLADRQYLAVLDLTAGPALRASEGKLDALIQSLAYAAGARGDKVRGYHLLVEDWTTKQFECHWPANTWPDAQ